MVFDHQVMLGMPSGFSNSTSPEVLHLHAPVFKQVEEPEASAWIAVLTTHLVPYITSCPAKQHTAVGLDHPAGVPRTPPTARPAQLTCPESHTQSVESSDTERAVTTCPQLQPTSCSKSQHRLCLRTIKDKDHCG